jgi:mRNA interferase HigB
MHIISRRALREFWVLHPDAEGPLSRWFKLAKKAEWSNFGELRAECPSADYVEHLIVINIGGNKYRLIIEVYFRDQVILVRHVLTHEDYDKGRWKARDSVQQSGANKHGKSNGKGPRTEVDDKGKKRRPRK